MMDNYFDFEIAMEYVGGYWHIFKDLQKKFISEYKNYEKALTKRVKKGKTKEAQRMIHSLKGISMNLGAVKLYKASFQAEENLSLNKPNPINDYLDIFSKTYFEIKKFRK